MILRKIRRRHPDRPTAGSEFAYMTHLSRYVVRADQESLRELALLSEDQYLGDLARYAVERGEGMPAVAVGAFNLQGDELDDWQVEMSALLHRCPDAVGAIDHWVGSLPEGATGTPQEVATAAATLLKCQDLSRCPAIWAIHGDTDNLHFHILVLRVDHVTGARQTAGGGWDIDTAHRAKAVIEAERPHWGREDGSRYVVRDGALIDLVSNDIVGNADDHTTWRRQRSKEKPTNAEVKRDSAAIDPQSIAYEERTGFMSRKRIAIEIAVPIILAAGTMDEAHAALTAEGIGLRRERRGANFVIDGKTVKASIDRRTSLAAMEAKFGEPLTSSPFTTVDRGPRERWPNDGRRRAYYAARRTHDDRLGAAVSEVRAVLGNRAAQGAASAALAAAANDAAFPSFATWHADSEVPDPAAPVFAAMGFCAVAIDGMAGPARTTTVLDGFRGTQLGDRIVYRAIGHHSGPAAFVDLGHKVLVNADTDHAAVRASLLLIATRFPDNKVTVTGNRAFQSLVLRIADDEGIVLDGALGRRQVVEADRERMRVSLPRIVDRAPAGNTVLNEVAGAEASRLLAMLGRVFHRADWDFREHWPDVPRGVLAEQIPAHLRSIEQVPASVDDVANVSHRPNAARSRQAAAIAAGLFSR